MISFFLTTKCNLACVYCYNRKERSFLTEKSLSPDIAKAGIDYFFENNSSRHIRFYGPGEPTQEFELMKEITEYAFTKAGSDLTVEIQTNGVFDNEVRKWMLNNVNIIWISFDGPPDIQNSNRPIKKQFAKDGRKSAEIIEENIRWFIQNRSNQNLMIGARVTITNLNVNRQKEMVDYFQNNGIKYIWTDPVFPEVLKKPFCDDKERENELDFDMDAYVKNYIGAFRYAKYKGVFYGSFLTCNFDGTTKTHCRACTPVPHLTPDGYISACDLVVFGEKSYHMDCFIYGRWIEEDKKFVFNKNKILALKNRNIDNMEHCKTCEAKFYCGGYCLGEVVNETGSLVGQKPKNCEAIRCLLKEIGISEKYDYLHP